MKLRHVIACHLLALSLPAAEIGLSAPLDFQVVQRNSRTEGTLTIRGTQKGLDVAKASWKAKIGANTEWQPLKVEIDRDTFSASITAPAGGWHHFEIQALQDGEVVAQSTVEHVGVGEVFVVAGQSNSANHGEEKQTTQTQRVSSFNGQ